MSGNKENIENRRLRIDDSLVPHGAIVHPRSSVLAYLCLGVSIVFLSLHGFAGTLPRVTAPAKFSLSGEKVTLGALLALDPADAKLAADLEAVVLTAAPAPGQTKILAGVEILRGLESVGVTTKTYGIVVPTEVAIRT